MYNNIKLKYAILLCWNNNTWLYSYTITMPAFVFYLYGYLSFNYTNLPANFLVYILFRVIIKQFKILINIHCVLIPETRSQELFHQIQKEVTFCGLLHGVNAWFCPPLSLLQSGWNAHRRYRWSFQSAFLVAVLFIQNPPVNEKCLVTVIIGRCRYEGTRQGGNIKVSIKTLPCSCCQSRR